MKLQKLLFGCLLVASLNNCAMEDENVGSATDDVDQVIDYGLMRPKELPNRGLTKRSTVSNFGSGFTSTATMTTTTSTNSLVDATQESSLVWAAGASESLPTNFTTRVLKNPSRFSTDAATMGVTETSSLVTVNTDDVPVFININTPGAFAIKKPCCLMVKILPHVVKQDYNRRFNPNPPLIHDSLPGCYRPESIAALVCWAQDLKHVDDQTGERLSPEANEQGKMVIRSSKEEKYNQVKLALTALKATNKDLILYDTINNTFYKKQDSSLASASASAASNSFNDGATE